MAYASGDANLYRYVGNAPVGATDPSGLMEQSVVGQSLLWGPSLLVTGGTNPHAFSQALDFVGQVTHDSVQVVLDAQPNWVLDSFLWSTAWVEPVAQRAGFAVQFVGGATEIAVGAGAFLSPEPAVTKVTGVLLVAHGFDNVINGAWGLLFGEALIREADDGEARLNFTSYWVEQGAEAIGFSEPLARELAFVADMAVPVGAEIAGSMRIAHYLQRNPAVRASERFQRWHSRGFGTLTGVRSATGRADEILRGGVLTDEWVQLMEAGGGLGSSATSKSIGRHQAQALGQLRSSHRGKSIGERAQAQGLHPGYATTSKGERLTTNGSGQLYTYRNGVWVEKYCFAAGTPLLTPDGFKFIEEFRPGDMILSRREDDPEAPVESRLVEQVFTRVGKVLELVVSGRVIRTTAEHPFWVKGVGWVPAGRLEVGQTLATHNSEGVATVEAVRETGREEVVYNLRVADWHTYFVGKPEWGFSV